MRASKGPDCHKFLFSRIYDTLYCDLLQRTRHVHFVSLGDDLGLQEL